MKQKISQWHRLGMEVGYFEEILVETCQLKGEWFSPN